MDINFWLTTPVDLSDGLNRPLGGAEVSAVQLASALSVAGDATTCIYCNTQKSYIFNRVCVKPYTSIRDVDLECLVVVRAHPILNTRVRSWFPKRPRLLLNWSGDAYDQPNNQLFWDKWLCEHLDAFAVKSKWQRETMLETFPALQGKLHVLKNGIDLSNFPTEAVEKDDNLFVWASTWYRGLHNLLKIWPMVRAELPDARLDVHAKTTLYLDGERDQQASGLFKALEELDGVALCDPIPQRELVQKLARAKLMLYPNSNFVESSCGVAQQSILAGTPVITSDRAGLPETIQSEGVCIGGEPGSDAYNKRFVKETLKLCRNQELYNRLHRQGLLRRTEESWDKISLKWVRFLESL